MKLRRITDEGASGRPQLHELHDSDSSDGSDADFFGDDAGTTPDPTSSTQEQQGIESAGNEETSSDLGSEDEQGEDEQLAHGAANVQSEGPPDAQSLFIPEPTVINEAPTQTDFSFTIDGLIAPPSVAHPASQDAPASSSGSESESDNEDGGPLAVTIDLGTGPVTFNLEYQTPPTLNGEVDEISDLIVESGIQYTQLRQPTKKPYFHLTVIQEGRVSHFASHPELIELAL